MNLPESLRSKKLHMRKRLSKNMPPKRRILSKNALLRFMHTKKSFEILPITFANWSRAMGSKLRTLKASMLKSFRLKVSLKPLFQRPSWSSRSLLRLITPLKGQCARRLRKSSTLMQLFQPSKERNSRLKGSSRHPLMAKTAQTSTRRQTASHPL